MKWFYKATTCLVGYDGYGVFETEDEDIGVAEDIAWEYAYDNAESFFSVIDENDSAEYEANGDEYMQNFIFDSDVYCNVVKYEPLLHNMFL